MEGFSQAAEPLLPPSHDLATDERLSPLARYQHLIVGEKSLLSLLYFEWCLLLGALPGAAGLFLRGLFWPRLFASCGRGTTFASAVTLRHPGRIAIGCKVVFSEGCICDARSPSRKTAINLGDDVTLSNNVMLSCKDGSISIGSRTGIGAQTIIQSAGGNDIAVGDDVIIGPACYIVGGGNYNIDRLDIPMWRQGMKEDGGVVLENDVWLGAGVKVLGGVTMGEGSVAAAGAVVTKSVPPRAVCAGVPARVIKRRSGGERPPENE